MNSLEIWLLFREHFKWFNVIQSEKKSEPSKPRGDMRSLKFVSLYERSNFKKAKTLYDILKKTNYGDSKKKKKISDYQGLGRRD